MVTLYIFSCLNIIHVVYLKYSSIVRAATCWEKRTCQVKYFQCMIIASKR